MMADLILDGVPVPQFYVDQGRCAAYVCQALNVGDPDNPRCSGCGRSVEFYMEKCRCGRGKPWVYWHELSNHVQGLSRQRRAYRSQPGGADEYRIDDLD